MAERVLIIDDEPDTRKVLRGFLTEGGFEVDMACDGIEGLAKVESFQPNLILLDLLMPGKSGVEVLKELKGNKATSSIPVVCLTALPDEEFDKTMLTLGVDRYISKPCDFQMLVTTVRESLEGIARD